MLRRSQLSGANYAYTRHPLDYFIDSMTRLEIESIEMYAASPHMYVYDYDRAGVKGIKRKLDAAGIRVVCLTAEQCMIPVSLSIDDAPVRHRSLDYYGRALEQASELEAPLMHMVAGGDYLQSDPRSSWDRAVDGIGCVAERAKELGVKIALEADRTSPVKNTCDIRKVIDLLGCDRIQALIDTNAVFHAGETLEEALACAGKDVAHIHFIDLSAQAGCLVPGEGDLPLVQALETLSRSGYGGHLTPELWGWRYLNEAEASMRRSRDFCWAHMI